MGRGRRTKKSEEVTKSAGRFGLRESVRTKWECRITWFGQRGSPFFFFLFPSPRGSVPNLPSSSESNLLILLPLSLHRYSRTHTDNPTVLPSINAMFRRDLASLGSLLACQSLTRGL
ncbi:hypothetical protein CGRA01v4_10172 [Colletotrichum graminicola]|nr:hypothetical protein CGRA01v4_10172 [Colletotrichum graminicola]